MPKNIRTCVGCGDAKLKKELLRLIRSPDGDLVVDWKANLGGRGAHVCPSRSCIARAIKKRGLDRAMKAQVNYPPVDDLVESVRESYQAAIKTLLSTCKTRRVMSAGTDEAQGAIKRGRTRLVILAEDYGGRDRMIVFSIAAAIPHLDFGTKEMLGELTDRRPTGILAIEDPGLADALARTITTCSKLS